MAMLSVGKTVGGFAPSLQRLCRTPCGGFAALLAESLRLSGKPL